MSKNRIIYNTIGIYAGTCNSTGYHFVDNSGYLVNSIYQSLYNGTSGYSNNLIRSLRRINQASYGFSESRTDIKGMGSYGTLARPIIATPAISLSLSYYSMGLINEEILGFDLSSGVNMTPISGFLNRTYNPR